MSSLKGFRSLVIRTKFGTCEEVGGVLKCSNPDVAAEVKIASAMPTIGLTIDFDRSEVRMLRPGAMTTVEIIAKASLHKLRKVLEDAMSRHMPTVVVRNGRVAIVVGMIVIGDPEIIRSMFNATPVPLKISEEPNLCISIVGTSNRSPDEVKDMLVAFLAVMLSRSGYKIEDMIGSYVLIDPLFAYRAAKKIGYVPVPFVLLDPMIPKMMVSGAVVLNPMVFSADVLSRIGRSFYDGVKVYGSYVAEIVHGIAKEIGKEFSDNNAFSKQRIDAIVNIVDRTPILLSLEHSASSVSTKLAKVVGYALGSLPIAEVESVRKRGGGVEIVMKLSRNPPEIALSTLESMGASTRYDPSSKKLVLGVEP